MTISVRSARVLLGGLTALSTPALFSGLVAQGTLDDYRRSAAVTQRLAGLTVDVAQMPTWIGPTRFWYRKSVKGGNEFVVVDASTGAKKAAFDHAKVATALSTATGETFSATTLPFTEFSYVDRDDSAIELDATGSRWQCGLAQYQCTRTGPARATGVPGGRGGPGPGGVTGEPPTPSTACLPPQATDATAGRGGRGGAGRGGGGRGAAPGGAGAAAATTGCVSPDGQSVAFVQNYNVAIRPVRASGRSEAGVGGSGGTPAFTMLTYDGSEGDAYQQMSIRWAPDSKKLVAYRRRPGYTRLVHYVLSSPTDQLQPKDTSIFYRKPGDLLDFVQPVVVDVAARKGTVVENATFPNAYQISQAVWRKDSHAFTFE